MGGIWFSLNAVAGSFKDDWKKLVKATLIIVVHWVIFVSRVTGRLYSIITGNRKAFWKSLVLPYASIYCYQMEFAMNELRKCN